ncbi:MAG: TIGR03086 family metal-binding protein [Ilumatobacteraceae bacterium]
MSPRTSVADIADRYRRRADRFDATVAAVPADRWASPSPCAEWTARDVVGHVLEMHAAMLRPLGRGLSTAPALDDDPLGAFRSARADIEGALGDPAVASSECDTPMGRMTLAEHVDGVASEDLVIHGWDLARAAGLDDTMDPVELERMWPAVQSIPDEMRIPGHFGPGIVVFGPAVDVPDDAPLQHRVLALTGRDPR